jgi:hypothetical protein
MSWLAIQHEEMSVTIGGGRLQWRGTTADHAYGASRGTARRAVQGLIRRILRHAVALPAARRFSTGLASLPILGTVFFQGTRSCEIREGWGRRWSLL